MPCLNSRKIYYFILRFFIVRHTITAKWMAYLSLVPNTNREKFLKLNWIRVLEIGFLFNSKLFLDKLSISTYVLHFFYLNIKKLLSAFSRLQFFTMGRKSIFYDLTTLWKFTFRWWLIVWYFLQKPITSQSSRTFRT